MTRAVRAPGIDRAPDASAPNTRSSRGAKGVFANYMQGATPKYAINNGFRQDLFRNTLARMFVRIDAAEMDLYLGSIGDAHTRKYLAKAIAGDPSPSRSTSETNQASPNPTAVRRPPTASTNGYLDFFVQQVQMGLQEKVQVSETLSDNYVAYAFGQSPPQWQFTGSLINSVQDDQASNMFRLYTQILRATQMARRQKSVSLSFDSYVVNGVITNLSLQLSTVNELVVPFSFTLLVKRVFITNYTANWVPTQANTPFAADLFAIAYDGRPREESALTRVAGRTSPGTEEVLTPTPQAQQDERVTLASGVETGTAPPNYTPAIPPNSPATQEPPTNPLVSTAPPRPTTPSDPAFIGPRDLTTSVPCPPQNTVVNPARPETVNPPGVSSNPNVSPRTPAPAFTPAQTPP